MVEYAEMSAPPPIEIEQPVVIEEPIQAATVKFLEPVATPDDEVQETEEYIPTQDELSVIQAGFETVEGDTAAVYSGEVIFADPEPEPEPEIFEFVEVMPSFPGGDIALIEYITENVVYPPFAMDMEIEGRVVIEFVVEPDGSITHVEVARGIGGGCDEEALRVVENMPNWIPGEQNGVRLPVRYAIPINFNIANN